MKQTILFLSMLISFSAFSQAPASQVYDSLVKDSQKRLNEAKKKDTVTVVIKVEPDTFKVKIYYESGNSIKIYKKGFVVRQLETNSADPSKNRIVGIVYFDEKWNRFTKTVFNATQR